MEATFAYIAALIIDQQSADHVLAAWDGREITESQAISAWYWIAAATTESTDNDRHRSQ